MFLGIVINKTDEGQTVAVQQIEDAQLPDGDVSIDFHNTTGCNYIWLTDD